MCFIIMKSLKIAMLMLSRLTDLSLVYVLLFSPLRVRYKMIAFHFAMVLLMEMSFSGLFVLW